MKEALAPVRDGYKWLSGKKEPHRVAFPDLYSAEDAVWEDHATAPNVSLPLPSNFDASTDVLNIGYGFLNGIVDVFPTESLPNYCRTNSTNTYWQVYRVFVDNQYDYAQEEDVY